MPQRILRWIMMLCIGIALIPQIANAAKPTAPLPQGAVSSSSEVNVEGTYERAIITASDVSSEPITGGAEQKRNYTVRYESGPLIGQSQTLSNELNSNPYDLQPAVGDHVVIYLQPQPGGGTPLGFLESYDRRDAMLWLIVLFVVTLVVLAGWQGFKVALSIGLSILLIGWVLIPAFLNGASPVPVAILIGGMLATISSVFSTGWNRKSWITIIGTMGGMLVAYAIALVFSQWAHLGGLATEEDRLFFEKNQTLDPSGLLFAGIIIAAIGVVEDVAVSIASGIVEVRNANPHIGQKELFRSGMIIGRDHMSALANTLIFAYVGGSLSTFLLYSQFGGSWLKFLNFDAVVDEVIRSLSGTIGLLFTVPITALLGAFAFQHTHDHKKHSPSHVTSSEKGH